MDEQQHERRTGTVECPVCGGQHGVRRVGGLDVIACPYVPPGKIYGLSAETWCRQA